MKTIVDTFKLRGELYLVAEDGTIYHVNQNADGCANWFLEYITTVLN